MYSTKGMGPRARMRSASRRASGVRAADRGGMASGLPLRVAGKHLNDVVVQAVIELLLEGPGELFVFDLTRPQEERVSVDLDAGRLEADFDFDAFGCGPRAENKQRVLVAGQLLADFFHQVAHREPFSSPSRASHWRRRRSMSSRVVRKNASSAARSPRARAGSGIGQWSRPRRAGTAGQCCAASSQSVMT